MLTNSVTLPNTWHIEQAEDRHMRFLAATAGLLGTLVLIAPFH